MSHTFIRDLNNFESTVYSQSGEDGILEAIFSRVGICNKFFVEFGVGDGHECNTRILREKQHWTGLLMDGRGLKPSLVKQEFITAENINGLFKKYNVPDEFDLLSIDLDGNDYWVWKALSNQYSPRVVVIEYNASIPPAISRTIEYDAHFKWDGTDYFGASLLALVKLGSVKGYTLVGCNNFGVNAFFVRNDLMEDNFEIRDIQELYRPPQYGKGGDSLGYPSSHRTMIEV